MMKNIKSFDIVNTPLYSNQSSSGKVSSQSGLKSTTWTLDNKNTSGIGQTLIEASAGTGKTYAIANIYLRLILERNLHPSQILVVTFTVPATAELRDRLRKNLKDAYKYISDKDDSIDKNVMEIIHNCLKNTSEAEIKNILYRSVLDFDEAAIFTIHSFCLNMLSENAFESGSLFDIEMIKDQSEIIDEVIEDYWRCQFYNSSELSEIIKSSGITINELKESAYYIVKNPDVIFLPEDLLNVIHEKAVVSISGVADGCGEPSLPTDHEPRTTNHEPRTIFYFQRSYALRLMR